MKFGSLVSTSKYPIQKLATVQIHLFKKNHACAFFQRRKDRDLLLSLSTIFYTDTASTVYIISITLPTNFFREQYTVINNANTQNGVR